MSKEFTDNLDIYIRKAQKFSACMTEFQDALKEMENIRKNLQYTPENPARFVMHFQKQSVRLCVAAQKIAKKAKSAGLLNKKYEMLTLNSGQQMTIEQYCASILRLFPPEVHSKNLKTIDLMKAEVKSAFEKKMHEEVFKPKFALEKELKHLDEQIRGCEQKRSAIFAYYEKQPGGFFGRSLVKEWMEKTQSAGGGYDAFRPFVAKIAEDIQKNRDEVSRNAQLKLLDHFRDYLRYEDIVLKCRSEITPKRELLVSLNEKAGNQEPIWNALMEQFLKDQNWSEPVRQSVLENAHMLYNQYMHTPSSHFQFPITKEEVEQLLATAMEQQKATQDILKQLETFFISTQQREVTRVVAPYLLQRTINPIIDQSAA